MAYVWLTYSRMTYVWLTYSQMTYVWMDYSQMTYVLLTYSRMACVWNLRESTPDISPCGVRKSPGGEPRGCRR